MITQQTAFLYAFLYKASRTTISFLSLGAVLILWGNVHVAHSRQLYVSPTGSASGNGSESSPWDLQTALDQPTQLSAGDTLWIAAGTYVAPLEGFVSVLSGTEAAPIIVRNQSGGRATIDGALHVRGSDTWYWGLEFTTTSAPPSSLLTTQEQNTLIRSGTFRRSNIQADRGGRGNRFINNIIQSNYESVLFSGTKDDDWLYGNIIVQNGRIASNGVAGDAVLVQFDQANGAKMIAENVISNNLANGLLTSGGGFEVKGNVFIANGRDALNRGTGGGQILALELQSVTFRDNFFYVDPQTAREEITHGSLRESTGGSNVRFENNILANGGFSFIRLLGLSFTGNTVGPNAVLDTVWPTDASLGFTYSFDNNHYSNTRFSYSFLSSGGVESVSADTSDAGFQMWRDSLQTGLASGGDLQSDYTTETPTQTLVLVRPNQFETGRANVVIMNWSQQSSIEIPVVGLLQQGAQFSLRRVDDFFGSPLISGTYNGTSPVISSDLLGSLDNTNSVLGVFILINETVNGGNAITPPVLNRSLPGVTINDGGSLSIELEGTSPVFGDQDPLTYSAVSSKPGVATAGVNGSNLIVQSVSAGVTHIAVSANDGTGGISSVGFTVSVVGATEYHVTTSGSPSGDGSLSDPWDLQTALAQPLVVGPGDIISLHRGVYAGSFWGRLVGTKDAPIIVRSFPGEWAVIDIPAQPSFDAFVFGGQHTHYRDFEIRSSDTDKIRFGTGTSTRGEFLKLINLVIHDVATNTFGGRNEVYGSLIYNVGDNSADGQGHDFYVQNDHIDNPTLITDNIIFNPYGFGIHIFAGGTGRMEGIHMTGNVVFGSGVPHIQNYRFDNIIVGGGIINPPDNILLRENMGWIDNLNARSISLGRFNLGANKGVTLIDNYLKGETNFSTAWESISMTGNMFIGPVTGEVDLSQYSNNTYLDQLPVGSKVFIRPNAYEPGRANLVIYNWELGPSVDVDLAGLFDVGTPFEIRNAQNVFGSPLVAGMYDGNLVSVPMQGYEPVQPIGPGLISPDEFTAPEFAVFLVRRSDSGTFVSNETLDPDESIPSQFAIENVFPNPASTSLSVQYQLGEPGDVSMEVVDILGRRLLIAELGRMSPGQHSDTIELGSFPSGVLFLRITSGRRSVVKAFIKVEM